MKKRVFILLMMAALSAGSVTGCASPEKTVEKIESETMEESRTEEEWIKLIKAYEKLQYTEEAKMAVVTAMGYLPDSTKLQELAANYLEAAPVPNFEPGTHGGQTTLIFTTQEHPGAELYVLVDREDECFWQAEEDKSVLNDGLYIFENPAKQSKRVELYSAGTHTVKAFLMKDGSLFSQVFEGEYIIEGNDFSGFAFSKESGEYEESFDLTFEGAEGTVYYTLDGSNPLVAEPGASGGIRISEKAIVLEGSSLRIGGNTKLKAFCKATSGLISPIIEAEYKIKRPFEANTYYVEEDFSRFDYVTNGKGIYQFDKFTGKSEKISGKEATHIAAFYAEGNVEDHTSSDIRTMHPEALLQSEEGKIEEEKKEKIWLWAGTSDNRVDRAPVVNGKLGEWEPRIFNLEEYIYFSFQRVGEGWFSQNLGDPAWCSDKPKYGDPEVVKKVTMLLDDMGVYVENDGSKNYPKYVVYACDSNGTNDRVLWENGEEKLYVDAMTDKVILYNTGGGVERQHMVYHLDTGKHTKNPYMEDGEKVWGYTSTAVYVNEKGRIVRRAVDYDALAQQN